MRFLPTSLPGVVKIELDPFRDARGYFARTWCEREAAAAGLIGPMVQHSIAFNAVGGTLRGLHYQAPAEQVRVMRCIAGAAFVAAVDLRRWSPTFLKTFDLVLNTENQHALYVPPGVAAGYQTLEDQTVIAYDMTTCYDRQYDRGVRWNDPAFGIRWPDLRPTIIARDAAYPDFDPDHFELV